ncbi:hypothetical protein [Bradyrhizobium sp. 23AC]
MKWLLQKSPRSVTLSMRNPQQQHNDTLSGDAADGQLTALGIEQHGNNDRLSTRWREVISIADVAKLFSLGSPTRKGATMKTQVRTLAAALAIAVPIAIVSTAESSAAPINGTSIKAAVPTGTTDVRYRRSHPFPQHWDYPAYYSSWGYPAYSSYWGYPTDESYDAAYGYGYYRSRCLPGPRVGAFATAPWTDTPTCPPY